MPQPFREPKQEEPRRPAKPKCGAKRRDGAKCRKAAGFGTDHLGFGRCRTHGGNTLNHRKKAAGDMATAQMLVMGMQLEVDPMDALLTCIRITAGEVVYTTDRVHELTPKQAVVTVKKTTTRHGELDSFDEVAKSNEARLNIWIQARHDAMDRLAKYSKMAIDCGIAERQVVVAEQTGQSIGRMLQAVLAELGLTDEQKELAPVIIQRNLILLESNNDPTEGE